MPRTFLSPNGYTILVGKDKYDNEHVSFELARAHDLWMHAHDFAGSHVVLQWDASSREEPREEDVQFALQLAAYYSKARGQLRYVPVYLCRACDIEKPKHGQPGRVLCLDGRLIMAQAVKCV